jgi:RNA polymerase sigma-70 factor (ECF subfamily)
VKKAWTKALLKTERDNHYSLQVFKKHYEESNAFVRKSIYWLVRNDQIDDIVQEAYLKAWANFSNFKKDSSFNTWIYRIARNTAFDYLKKHKEVDGEDLEQNPQAESSLEKTEIISKALLAMNPEHREAFILYYKLGYTKAEIGNLLEVPEGTIKSRVHHAKSQFIASLKSMGVDYE